MAPGVHWIRMPLPFALDHINLWVLEDGNGCVLVDTGYESDETKDLWHTLFDGVFAHLQPHRLVCTHHHPDHMGLAGWLTKKHDIPLWTTEKEWHAFHRWFVNDQSTLVGLMETFYRRGGVPGERQQRDLERRRFRSKRTGSEPEDFHTLKADDVFEAGGSQWEVRIGEGHAPELAALFDADRKILISGDQVLPKISPNVSVMPFDLDANPLKVFMESLKAFTALPADTLVLPSHKLPFVGLHQRIESLLSHHEERLDRAMEACAPGATPAYATTILFPRALNDHQYFFALGETLAHLNYLWHEGLLTRDESANGSFVFKKS